MLTPCTVGNGWLRIFNFGIYALSLYDKFTGQGVRVRLDVDKLERWPHTRIWLLKEKPKSEQEPDLLRAEMAASAADMLSISKVQIRPGTSEAQGQGRDHPLPALRGMVSWEFRPHLPFLSGGQPL